MRRTLRLRSEGMKRIRNNTVVMIRTAFVSFLHLRAYDGKLLFDFDTDPPSLAIQV